MIEPTWFPLPASLHWARVGQMPSVSDCFRADIIKMMKAQRGVANSLDVAFLMESTSGKAIAQMKLLGEDGTVEVIARLPKTWRLK